MWSFLDFVCRCRTCAFNCRCARLYVPTVCIWVCGRAWHLSVQYTSEYTSEHTCGHLNIHPSIHVVIWVCGRAWRLCAAPLPGSVPASEKSPDFSFQSLRCEGWYVGGLSDQKSYQTPLIFVIFQVSDQVGGFFVSIRGCYIYVEVSKLFCVGSV